MASACQFLLYRCETAVWKRGEDYADTGKVEIITSGDKEIIARARGTSVYNVRLVFAGGGISKTCDCPYAAGSSSQHAPCKHMIASAILWDESRGISRPNTETVEEETIPPPVVSRAQLNAIFKDPLNADLDILRVYIDESGRWSRPHAHLPVMPAFVDLVLAPITIEEVKSALSEMNKWTSRRNFDPYFCAGEMVAAFCEVLRCVDKRLAVTPVDIGADILERLIAFNQKLMTEKLDTSDGVHVFSEEHLRKICATLKDLIKDGELKEGLKKIEKGIGKY